MKNRNTIFAAILFVFALLCAAAAPKAFGVVPAPDGGYTNLNTAEGEDALLNLTTGFGNTAVGFNALFSHTTGAQNTATGLQALFTNTTGSNNTATGGNALISNEIGNNNTASGQGALENNLSDNNTATGTQALLNNVDGTQNTANGVAALLHNTTGSDNTATGLQALFSNTSGNSNTVDGADGLLNNTTGNSNVALGDRAGFNLTTGSNNIIIGAGVLGNASDTNTIRIGKSGTQQKTFIAGISGKTVANGVGVIIGTTGQLGTVVSSARFKEAIKPMDKTSEAILALNPVTFRYKKELDPEGIPQFGLVAEQVEKVNPALVARDEQGKPYTVRYEAVNAMLLNEFLKQHRKVEEQDHKIQKQEATIAKQQKQIEALTTGLQTVSDQLELSKPAPRMADNHQ